MIKEENYSQWYPRDVGAIMRKTEHLSLMQMGAYDRLLDWYYANEKPIPLDRAQNYRICKAVAVDEQGAVDYVVSNFFKEMEDGFHNERADFELKKRSQIKVKRQNAQAEGERKRRAKDAQNTPQTTPQVRPQVRPTPTPTGIEVVSTTSIQRGLKFMDEFNRMFTMYPSGRKGNRDRCYQAFLRALQRATPEEIENGIRKYKNAVADGAVEKQYIKGFAAWLNDDRWNYEYPVAAKKPDAGRRGGYSLQEVHDLAIRDKPLGPEGREERLAALGLAGDPGDV